MNAASVGHQCPECVAEGRRSQRPVRTAFGATSRGAHGYVTISLIAINCAMLLFSLLSSKSPGHALGGGHLGGLVGGSTPLMDKLAVHGQDLYQNQQTGAIFGQPVGVADGEYYRLFTAMFMHYGLLHLATNMWALWVLGRPLEAMFGPLRFLAIYLVCGLGGSVAAYIFSPNAKSAGASTAIFGLFAVFFFVLRKLERSVAPLIPVLVINLVITFGVPGISIAGHLGGLITGAILGAGIAYAPQAKRSLIQGGVIAGVVVLLGIATAIQTAALSG
jgi:membrane associated rhomboid family serine protease